MIFPKETLSILANDSVSRPNCKIFLLKSKIVQTFSLAFFNWPMNKIKKNLFENLFTETRKRKDLEVSLLLKKKKRKIGCDKST